MDENDLLNEKLAQMPETTRKTVRGSEPPAVELASNPNSVSYCQWAVCSNGIFRPAGPQIREVPPGLYNIGVDQGGLYLSSVRLLTDSLIELEDSASIRVLDGMRKFWASKEKYIQHDVLYKRGVLLWGPAGSGKSCTVALLVRELIHNGGIVILSPIPELTVSMLSSLRLIEPERNIIVVLEDIEEILQRRGEHELLSLLDGENQVDNVVNIATTNYPEVLGARIVNRPSRFDERIYVGMPSATAREKYLRHITKSDRLPDAEITRWVSDTEGFSLAHMRELSIAVQCLDQKYEDVLKRLRKMGDAIRPMQELKRGLAGFANEDPFAGIGEASRPSNG